MVPRVGVKLGGRRFLLREGSKKLIMTMQIPENPSNNDIREALIQLGSQVSQLSDKVDRLDDKVEKLDYKFDMFQKGTDGMVRMATTIIIATVSAVIFSGLTPAFAAIVTAFHLEVQGKNLSSSYSQSHGLLTFHFLPSAIHNQRVE